MATQLTTLAVKEFWWAKRPKPSHGACGLFACLAAYRHGTPSPQKAEQRSNFQISVRYQHFVTPPPPLPPSLDASKADASFPRLPGWTPDHVARPKVRTKRNRPLPTPFHVLSVMTFCSTPKDLLLHTAPWLRLDVSRPGCEARRARKRDGVLFVRQTRPLLWSEAENTPRKEGVGY